MQHVTKKTLEYYVPEEGRAVKLWPLFVTPQDFLDDLKGAALKVTKAYLETGLELERDALIGAGRHDRADERADYRNGYYWRKSIQTAIGRIEMLKIPRCRKRSLIKAVREQLDRSKGAFEQKVVEMFLKGLSVRSIGPVLDGLLGLSISAGQVSRLARRCDRLVAQYHSEPISDEHVYMFLDAIHLKRRSAPRLFRRMSQARQRVVLVAYGVTSGGIKKLIGFQLEPSESESAWRRFLGRLRRRGLAGRRLKLIVTDGGKGLLNALDDFYPETGRQRCWFHKMSNVLAKLRKANARACLAGLRRVYCAKGRAAAERAYHAWAREWAGREPDAVRCVERDLEDLLTFYAMPKRHWRMLRTTNAIERCFREVRRRTRSIGCFVNDASLERMIYGLFRFLNERRAKQIAREFRNDLKAA